MEQQIKLAAKLYRCRDTVKRFFKEDYKEKILPYQKIISGLSKAKNIGELEAMLLLCEDDTIKPDEWSVMLIMAAGVELIEPTK